MRAQIDMKVIEIALMVILVLVLIIVVVTQKDKLYILVDKIRELFS